MVITLAVYKIVKIFGSMVWFSGMANLMMSFNFTPDPPWLLWQQNLGQNGLTRGYNSARVRDICEIFASIGEEGFRDGPLNAANRISPDRPPLPWQRNFGQNWL